MTFSQWFPIAFSEHFQFISSRKYIYIHIVGEQIVYINKQKWSVFCYSKSLNSCKLQVIAILGSYIINQKDNNLFLSTRDSSKWFLYTFETY